MFDDERYPKLNTLYIHLSDGDYYSDTLFSKRKTEREKDMLILLAARLGLKKITYKTITVETEMKRVRADATVAKNSVGITFAKTEAERVSESSSETYANHGSFIYCLSKTRADVTLGIESQFHGISHTIFSLDYYRSSPSLQAFVIKRFELKAVNMEYITQTENELDISFSVRATLMDYGLGFSLDKYVAQSERISCSMDFYSDKELRLALNMSKKVEQDPFYMIREAYDNEKDKDSAVFHITEYVRKYATICSVTFKDRKGLQTVENFKNRLSRWIKKNGNDAFKEACHEFTSSYQIRTWFRERRLR